MLELRLYLVNADALGLPLLVVAAVELCLLVALPRPQSGPALLLVAAVSAVAPAVAGLVCRQTLQAAAAGELSGAAHDSPVCTHALVLEDKLHHGLNVVSYSPVYLVRSIRTVPVSVTDPGRVDAEMLLPTLELCLQTHGVSSLGGEPGHPLSGGH